MPNQQTRRDISWSLTLPALEPEAYDRLRAAGLPIHPDDPIEAVMESLGAEAVAASVVRSGVLRSDFPLLTVLPALLLVAETRIEAVSTRLANALRRFGFEQWQNVMLLRVDEFVALNGVGVGTGNELVRSALVAGLEALRRGSSAAFEQQSSSQIPFLDRMPSRLRASIDELGADADEGELARAIGQALVLAPDELRRERLSELFAGLDRLDVEIPLGRLAGSLAAALSARAWTHWAHTATASVDDVRAIPNVGQGKATDFLALLAQAWLGQARLAEAVGDDDQASLVASLRLLAAWARGEQQQELLGSVIQVSLPEDVPADVVAAAAQLASTDLGVLAGRLAQRYSIWERVLALREELDERELHILQVRVLTTGKAPTLEDVGATFGLTRERVRQVQHGLTSRLRDRVDEPDMGPLLRRARRLRRDLGVAVPSTAPELVELSSVVASDDDSGEISELTRGLLLWLAGPYVDEGGWLIASGDRSALDDLPGRLRTRASDGLIPWDAVREEASAAGLRPDLVEAWLERAGGFRPEAEGLLPWQGSVTDKCEVALLRLGEPATVEALVDRISEGYSVRSVRNRLFEDPRFVRTSKTEIGLREWGVDEYTSVVVEMAEEIERRGGRAELVDLAGTLADRYGVSRSSVHIYATTAPMFRTENGVVRMREPDEPITIEIPLEDTVRCYLIDGRWGLRVDVDFDLLRGSGRNIPPAFSQHLGVLPGDRKEFTTAYGTVTVTWPMSSAMGPSIGSLREEATSLRGERGDYLFIRFLGDAGLDCRLLRRETVDSATSLDRLCLMVGQARLDRPEGDALRAIAASIGAKNADGPEARFAWPVLRVALLRRGEQRLADSLETSPAPSEEEALERLWNALQ